MAHSSVASVALAVALKDLRVEWRTKTAFLSAMVFAVLVLAVLYFARNKTAVGDYALAPGALWVTFTFAGMLGLNRAFLLERDNRALDGLRLTPASPTGRDCPGRSPSDCPAWPYSPVTWSSPASGVAAG